MSRGIVRSVFSFVADCFHFGLTLSINLDKSLDRAIPNIRYVGLIFLLVWFVVHFSH